jgi:protein-tyrosine-phosphatase
MAMVLFQRHLAQRHMASGWHVESGGTWTHEGAPAARQVQAVMRTWGLDLSTHRSRCVRQEWLTSFDLILTMERGHQEALRIEFLGIDERTYLLSEMAGAAYDIPDPINGSLTEVRDVAREIDLLLQQGFDQIVERAQLTARFPLLSDT